MVVTRAPAATRPPISDTAIRFPIAGADNVQPDWVSRHFDSVYSVAITEDAVYLGGHFQFEPSPTAPSPWPGLTNVGYGTGQGLSGYGLGDDVVRRDHLGASTRPPGTPSSGTRARTPSRATRPCWPPRAACSPVVTPASRAARASGASRSSTSTTTRARRPRSTPPSPRPSRAGWWPAARRSRSPAPPPRPPAVTRVQVEIQDRNTKRWLAADGVTWQTSETNALATLDHAERDVHDLLADRGRSPGTSAYFVYAKTFGDAPAATPSKAVKKIESFDLTDQTPTTSITGPSGSIIPTLTFTMTGYGDRRPSASTGSRTGSGTRTTSTCRRTARSASVFNTFSGRPGRGRRDRTRPGRYDVTLPHEGTWRGSATAIDTAGQADLRSDVRDWLVSTLGGRADGDHHGAGRDDPAVHGAGRRGRARAGS